MASTLEPDYHAQQRGKTTHSVNDNLPPGPLIIRRKKVTRDEQATLLAMLEIGDSTGQMLFIRVRRIAHHACLSPRTVQRVIWGRKPPGGTARIRGSRDLPKPTPDSLVGRGVLQELAPANCTKRKATTYCLHADLLNEDPLKTQYYDQPKLAFTPTLAELEEWHRTHLQQWREINKAINTYAAQASSDARFSPGAAVAFAIGQARKYGMPYRLAALAFKAPSDR